MERVYLDCSGLPHSISVGSDLPRSIYIDASDLQRVLDNFLQTLPNAITEGMRANPLDGTVMQKIAEIIERLKTKGIKEEQILEWVESVELKLESVKYDAEEIFIKGKIEGLEEARWQINYALPHIDPNGKLEKQIKYLIDAFKKVQEELRTKL